MERKKDTLIWHFIFVVAIGVLIYLTLLNLQLVTQCLFDCTEYRNKLLIYRSSLAFVVAVYVFYLRRVVPSVPQKNLASIKIKKAKMKDSDDIEQIKEE